MHVILMTGCSSNPFCGVRDSSDQLGCTLDRGAVAQCNRVSFTSELDRDFQVADCMTILHSFH